MPAVSVTWRATMQTVVCCVHISTLRSQNWRHKAQCRPQQWFDINIHTNFSMYIRFKVWLLIVYTYPLLPAFRGIHDDSSCGEKLLACIFKWFSCAQKYMRCPITYGYVYTYIYLIVYIICHKIKSLFRHWASLHVII